MAAQEFTSLGRRQPSRPASALRQGLRSPANTTDCPLPVVVDDAFRAGAPSLKGRKRGFRDFRSRALTGPSAPGLLACNDRSQEPGPEKRRPIDVDSSAPDVDSAS